MLNCILVLYTHESEYHSWIRSRDGIVVKLLACGERSMRFDSRSRYYDLRDWLSPASKSRYDISQK